MLEFEERGESSYAAILSGVGREFWGRKSDPISPSHLIYIGFERSRPLSRIRDNGRNIIHFLVGLLSDVEDED